VNILVGLERAVIVYNPAARNAPDREKVSAAAAAYRASGWEVDLRATEAAGHARSLAAEAAASGSRVVFACGGDGTINEVVNGIASTPSALAVLRGGMGDVFGKEVRVPRDALSALRVLTDGEEHRIDLGMANERYFLLMAGVGFDGEVVRRVPPGPKRWIGSTAYVLWATAALARYRARQVEVVFEDEKRSMELYWLLLGNTRSYGGVLNITGHALADDGLLDGYTFCGHGLGWAARTAARIAVGRQDGSAGVSFFRTADLEVLTPGLPVQADGEYFGETPMRFGVAPRALSVLAPKGALHALLSH
jgi:diacylglycerol kinase (ATP)